MNKNRLWLLGSTVAILAILAIGWVIGIAPQLSAASAANVDRANAITTNAKNQILLEKLKSDFANIDALKGQLTALRTSVPTQADISSFVTELNSLASTRKVILKSIVVSDAKAYAPVPSTAGSSPTSDPNVALPKLDNSKFIIIPVQISVSGDYGRVLEFINDVQMGKRLFLASSLSSTGSTNSKSSGDLLVAGSQKVDSSIGGYIYVLLN